MNINDIIGKRIFELRKSKNLTAEKLAWYSGLSKSCVCSAEKGEKNIKATTLSALCNGMDITLAEFFSTFTEKNINH